MANTPRSIPGGITLDEVGSDPTTPAAGKVALYGKANSVYIKDEAGVVTDLSAGGSSMVVVNHGSTAGTTRPAGANAVYWIGSVEPTNMVDGDLWWDTRFSGGNVTDTDLYSLVQDMATADATTLPSARTYADSSGNGLTATEYGYPTTTVDSPWSVFNKAIQFAGGNHYTGAGVVEAANTNLIFAGLSSFTVEAKIKPTALPTNAAVIAGVWTENTGTTGTNIQQWILYLDPSGTLSGIVTQSGPSGVTVSSSAGAIVANTAYDVAFVYDSASNLIRLFINGTQVNTAAVSGSGLQTPAAPPPLSIGAESTAGYASDSPGWPYEFAGVIEEVRISNTNRYGAAGYTPSTLPFNVDTYTKGLWHLNETYSLPSDSTLTINSVSLGKYEYLVVDGPVTISAYNADQWFTRLQDSKASFIIVKGNLTINAGQTLTPRVRKLFTCIYVTGNLVVNGGISMSQRGANHSGTGSSSSATTAAAIRIASGTFSSVTNPQVPAAGGAGASGVTGGNYGNTGTAGTAGGTGGGGSGGNVDPGSSGSGAAGTSFSGGAGSGAARNTSSANAGTNGGAGSAGVQVASGYQVGGGAGNPGGAAGDAGGSAGANGTGGILIVFVEGTLSGSGTITAAGAVGGAAGGGRGGGGSGGGSITIMVRGSDTGPTPTALGGAGGVSAGGTGGSGGAGTARKLVLT